MPFAMGRSVAVYWEIHHCSWEARHHCPLRPSRVSGFWVEEQISVICSTMPYLSPSLAFIDMTAFDFFFSWSDLILFSLL